jgi:hypothetical protein
VNNNPQKPVRSELDRVEGTTIFLDGDGAFPKRLIITERKQRLEYVLMRTKFGKYLLNK